MDFAFGAHIVNMMIALIISLTVHEATHAFMARVYGDRTAQLDGRLTLNPVPHIDPIGTLLFPLIGAVLGGFIFGWAKPVPIDPRNFRNQKWGQIIVAGSGPFSNLLLSFVSLIIVYLIGPAQDGTIWLAFSRLATAMVSVNAILAIFNMIPVHPLDGGAVLYELLPYEGKRKYEEYVMPYGSFALLGLMLLGGFAWIGALAGVWVHLSERIINSLL